MELFKYKPWNEYTEDVITNSHIFFPSKEKLNDPSELIHPIKFEQNTWHPSFQNASRSIDDATRAVFDKINDRFSRLEALEVAHEDDEYERYRDKGDHFRRVVEAVYDNDQVGVHQAIRYYMLTDAEDQVSLYDSEQNIVDRLNGKLSALGMLCFAQKGDCPVMWAHYADNHRGIVLIFDPRKDSMMGSPKKLKYVKTRPTITVDNVIETLYTKAKAWAYEAEYRILKKKGDECYAFDQEALTGVILGMNMTGEIKNKVVDVIRRSKHKISLYQAYSDASTYRIMRRPVDPASFGARGEILRASVSNQTL